MTSDAAVNSDAHDRIRSLLKIFEYAAKQACKPLQRNEAKLSEPASINGLHTIRVYARASRYKAHTVMKIEVGISKLLQSVLLVYPLLEGQLGVLILELFKCNKFVRPRWPYDMRPSVRAEKYIRYVGP